MRQYLKPATLLRPNEVEDILGLRWAVDCLHMKLMAQGTDKVRYIGAGCIRHRADGRLEYVIYDTTTDFSLQWGGGLQLGDSLGPEHFSTLTATAVDGRVWTADRVDANISNSVDNPGVVVRGIIRQLTCRTEVESSASGAILHATGSFRIPTNVATETITTVQGRSPMEAWHLNVWRLNTFMGEIDVTDRESHIEVRLRPADRELTKDVTVRLEEAISFILGTHVRWTIEQSASGGEGNVTIRTGLPTLKSPRLGPPIRAREREALPHAEKLFDLFLNYVVSTAPNGNRYHPLAVSILAVLRASGSVIEDEALMLSVEVEAITKRVLMAFGPPEPTFLAQLDDVLKHLRSWNGEEEIRKRVLSAVGRLKGSDTPTALKSLAQSGYVARRHWDSWRALRNRAAHGAREWNDVHELRTECDIVHQLLLLLVFKIVGYDGCFTDYTTPNWPLKQTPRPSGGGLE